MALQGRNHWGTSHLFLPPSLNGEKQRFWKHLQKGFFIFFQYVWTQTQKSPVTNFATGPVTEKWARIITQAYHLCYDTAENEPSVLIAWTLQPYSALPPNRSNLRCYYAASGSESCWLHYGASHGAGKIVLAPWRSHKRGQYKSLSPSWSQ